MPPLTDYFCLRRKFLLQNLISRNLKIRYRKSLLGMMWTVLIPASSAVVYYVIFKFVMKVTVENYLLLILSGLIPWTFFVSALNSGTETIVGNYSLLNKVPLPPQALVLSDIMTHFLNFMLSLPVIAVVMVITETVPGVTLLQYFVLMGLLFLQSYGLGLIFGISYVYFRDMRFVVALILQFWFYLTPVMYASHMVPEDFRFLLWLNPVGVTFEGFHAAAVDHRWLGANEWLIILAWCLGTNFLAYGLLQRQKYRIIELL
ncbi:MAG: ABC transporter permease [Bdellovibrionaceae bacterium]|nr:ABC transporter permease [Pseudobdellovibrionaceae bacterium]